VAEFKEAVANGIAEITASYGSDNVRAVPDGQGGAWVEIKTVALGMPYEQDNTFLICQLQFTLPAADVYPMFLRGDLSRADKLAHGQGFSATQLNWPGAEQPTPVTQVSRRTQGDFTAQTPLQKIEKVLGWIRSR
jgi:hypothetical protein